MYNRSSSSFHKKHLYNFEDEPPEKKMVSDADIFIKQLAEKQRNTKTSLEEQLSAKHEFYKATEIVPLTNYTSGSSSLGEFTSLVNQSDEIEKLKSNGLSNDDIQLFFDYQKGREHFLNKHKNINETILENRMKYIMDTIHKSSESATKSTKNTNDRLKTELVLAAKPTSIETKLLKFAIANQNKKEENLPHPMDTLKDIEKELTSDLNINTKKIRRKIRSLQKRIDSINNTQIQAPGISHKNSSFSNNSQWDVKEPQSQELERKKVYSCKPQNHYTIRNGEIIQIKAPDFNQKYFPPNKLSVEEIKKNPKFANYTEGSPSKTLYLKNLATQVTEEELKNIINEFSGKTAKSVKIMKGKMRGQAFVETESEEVATSIIKQCNGVLLHNKPIIIQFGKAQI